LNAITPGNRLVKFADDTYLVVPASNADSRTAEIRNVETWACRNNLTLNSAKTKEFVFVDRHRRRQTQQPPLMSDIARVSSMNILGVTWTTGLSASDHVRDVINRCAQSLYAIRLLRTQGMSDQTLQAIYRSVIVAKLLYMRRALGGASPQQPTSNESTPSSDGVRSVVSALQICRRSMNSAQLLMRNCSRPFYKNLVTHYTVYYRHLPSHLKTIILGLELIT